MTFDEHTQPYGAIAGELIADFIAFGRLVEARRPEIAGIPGRYHLTIDAAAGTAILGKLQEDGRIVLVERVLIDPADAARFGSSELPMFVADGPDARSH